jgi:DNA repair ATPase RecN
MPESKVCYKGHIMEDPVSTGIKAVDIAVREARIHVEKAKELDREDVRACRHYLDAASECIHGLENGYEELLVKVETCIPKPEEISTVREQINRYLQVHELRRRLKDATDALEEIKVALERRAHKFWQWFGARRKKQAAVEEFANLLGELTNYLAMLENNPVILLDRPDATGVAADSLHDMDKELGIIQNIYLRGSVSPQDIPEERKTRLWRMVQKAREYRSKEGLEPITGTINTTIEKLRKAFAA